MQNYALTHLDDKTLLRDLSALVARDRISTASLLAHIGEVDDRRLYVTAGYPSMHAYCVEVLRLSEDSAYKRIRAARAARQFPALFAAVAEGRLHVAAVCLLASHLTSLNAEELIEAATFRRKFEIEQYLVRRFGAPESPGAVRPAPPGAVAAGSLRHLGPRWPEGPVAAPQLALGPVGDGPVDAGATVETAGVGAGGAGAGLLAPTEAGASALAGAQELLAPGPVGASVHVAPAATPIERYSLKVTIDEKTHEKLRYAQALLSHAVARGDLAQVLDRALEALILQLERQKFGATTRPRRARPSQRRRYIPAHVRRSVWERDRGQCTFMSASGKRCEERRFLEFDHVQPVARGGRATVAGLRLRCRTHNQYEAERAFGAAFMKRKTEEARRRRTAASGFRPENAPPDPTTQTPGELGAVGREVGELDLEEDRTGSLGSGNREATEGPGSSPPPGP